MITYAVIFVAMLTSLFAIRGDTWDKNEHGIKKLTRDGRILAFFAVLSAAMGIGIKIDENLDKAFRQTQAHARVIGVATEVRSLTLLLNSVRMLQKDSEMAKEWAEYKQQVESEFAERSFGTNFPKSGNESFVYLANKILAIQQLSSELAAKCQSLEDVVTSWKEQLSLETSQNFYDLRTRGSITLGLDSNVIDLAISTHIDEAIASMCDEAQALECEFRKIANMMYIKSLARKRVIYADFTGIQHDTTISIYE